MTASSPPLEERVTWLAGVDVARDAKNRELVGQVVGGNANGVHVVVEKVGPDTEGTGVPRKKAISVKLIGCRQGARGVIDRRAS